MAKTLIFGFIIILCVVLTLLDSFAPPKSLTRTDKALPPIAFTALDGTRYTLDQFKDKVIILNIWATWCTPCIAEMPQLLELAKREEKRVVFIALSVDETPQAIEAFLKRLPLEAQEHVKLAHVIIAHDKDKAISKGIFHTALYPETFIITPDMRIQAKIEGITDWLGADIKNVIYHASREEVH